MNKDNILAVADAIEKHSIADLGFNMGEWFDNDSIDRSGHNCGTTACIAGWAAMLAQKRRRAPKLYRTQLKISACDTARAWLDLSFGVSDALFFARAFTRERSRIEPAEAVAVLRHLAETGDVDWSIAS